MSFRKRIILAAVSGLLTAFAFPKFNFSFFVWVSLIPLLLGLFDIPPKRAFLLGLVSGAFFYAVLLYWIPYVPAHYGNISFGLSLFIYVILFLFLALFWALFAFLANKISHSFPHLVFFLIPFLWVSKEYGLTYLFTGFPWGLLGYAQGSNLLFLQTATLAGVYGLSFLLVLFQSIFVYCFFFRKRLPFLLVVGLVLLIHLGGFLSLKKANSSSDSFKASVIQGNVSSDIYWDRISTSEIISLFDEHLELTRQASLEGSPLIIWPEFSVPLCFSCSESLYQFFKEKISHFVRETNSTLLLGTNETTHGSEGLLFYNTALCLRPDLSISQYYKMHLVPFGEYTPYKKIFFFIEKVTHAIGDITPGKEHVLHQFESFRFGSPICYEIIFPDLVRRFVKKGAHFLVTITNDGWYGKSSAPYQHFAIARFRAVENRRFLLRAATTGISGIVDPYGRILAKSELMTKTFLTETITPSQRMTVYTLCGDILPWLSLTLSAIFFILSLGRRKNERKKI